MATTLITAGVGLVFWALAARAYPAAVVGAALAQVSTVMLVSTLCQLNLANVFPRFLPVAGARTARFVLSGYAITLTLSGLASAVFAASDYGQRFLVDVPFSGLVFVVSVVLFTLFTLQDAVMTGLRRTEWVPVENAATAIARVLLLFAFVGLAPEQGLVLAWLLPIVAAVVAVTGYLFREAIPAHGHDLVGGQQLPGRRDFLAHAAGEYAIGMVANLVPLVLPLIVVAQLGTAANAYFYLPWLINSALNLLISNITTSLVVEATTYLSRAQVLLRRAARMAFLVAVLGSIGELLFAPIVLGLLGSDYASEGSKVSQLLALAVPLNVINVLFAGICRIDRQIGWLVISQTVTGSMMLGGAWFLSEPMGVHGVALGYFAAQVIPALVLLPFVATRLLSRARHRAVGAVDRGKTALPERAPDLRRLRVRDERTREQRTMKPADPMRGRHAL